MLLHDIPKEKFEPVIPEDLWGLKNYLYETSEDVKLRIHSDYRVEFSYRGAPWTVFPQRDITGWRTFFTHHNDKPWLWDRIEFVP